MINTVPVIHWDCVHARDMPNFRLSIASIPVMSVQTGYAGSGQRMQNGSRAVVNSELQHRSSCREELGIGRVGSKFFR